MRKSALIALLLSVALAITGCAQLPRSSEIKTGPDLQSGLSSDYLYYSPSGPNDGDDQTAIINGFINAATGPQNDYQIARQYLSRDFTSKWNPSDGVLIQETRAPLTLTGKSTANVVIQASASIDAQGRWTPFSSAKAISLNFELIQEDGQWRISSAPNLTVLVRPVFDVLFKSYSLYFYDSQNRYLVPDLRWFPSRVSTGTRLVNALLTGPSDWLSSSVSNSFPAGTKLALDAVTVENGTAVVDLNAGATKANANQRSQMLSQLTATLNQLPNVFSVKIQIDHTPQTISLVNAQLPYPTAYEPMILQADGIRSASSAQLYARESAAALRIGANDFSYSSDGSYLALRSDAGVSVLKVNALSSELTKVDSRAKLLAPEVDNRSAIWTLPTDANQPLQAHDENGKLLFSWTGWITKGDHLAFGISREGSRLAVLLKTNKGSVAYVAAIKRNEVGVPIGIGTPVPLGVGLKNLISLTWSGDNSLAAISSAPKSLPLPVSIFVGGSYSLLSALSDAKQLLAQNDSSAIFALSSSGLLYAYRGMSWIVVATGVTAAHFTGN